MKRLTLLSVIVTIAIIIACAFVVPAHAEQAYCVYPRTAWVFELDIENNTVVLIDGAGLLWELEELDDWQAGDVVSLLMFDNGTESIYDDIILVAFYGGLPPT